MRREWHFKNSERDEVDLIVIVSYVHWIEDDARSLTYAMQ